MNSKRKIISLGLVIFIVLPFLASRAWSYEIFIYRPSEQKKSFLKEKKLTIHGEFFGQLQYPSTFPSYNDLSGAEDRWNFGFRAFTYFTDSTSLLFQLVTHDDGGQRTKFDWHFSLRQDLYKNLVLVLGHDSDHDSDHVSIIEGRPSYTNRNYIGVSLPFGSKAFLIEPFTWFFHHTNQRTYLDLSGSKLKQEYGIRMGALIEDKVSLHFQFVVQSDSLFYKGQMILSDLIIRLHLARWLELAWGGGIWSDRNISPDGNKQTFIKLIWGIAIVF